MVLNNKKRTTKQVTGGEQGTRFQAPPEEVARPGDDSALYKALIESAPVFFHRSATNGDLLWSSAGFYEYSGLTPDRVLGQAWRDEGLVHPDDIDPTVKQWIEGSRTGQPFDLEMRLRGADGVYRWFLSNQVPLRDADRIVEWIGTSTNINDRKLAAEELLLNERRFRTLTDTAPVFVFRTDAQGRLRYASERFYEYTGLAPEDVQGDRWQLLDLLHPEDRDSAVDGWRRAVSTGRSDGAEVRLKRSDGSYRWYLTRVAPVYDGRGQIAEWAGTSTDIDDRKQAELALRESEEDLRDFFDNSPVPLHWVGPDGNILRVNQAELDLLGYTEKDYVGHQISKFHADQDLIENLLARLHAGETLRSQPARMVCKDGSIKHVLIDSSVRWRDGEFIHTRCFTQDVTASKLAEEALASALANEAEARSLLDTMIDAVPAGIVFVDRALRYLTLNRAAAEINGVPVEDHLGRRGPELFPDLPGSIWDTLGQVIQSGEPIRDMEITAEAPSAPGAVRWWSVSVYPVTLPNGSTTGAVEVFYEITERKRAEIAQKFIADATAELASSLDHESTLRRVARLAVPAVCDVCVVDIVENGIPRRLDGVGATEEEAELIAGIHMRDWRLPGHEQGIVYNALMEGRPVFLPQVPLELLQNLAPNENQLRLATALAPRSVIQLPLTTRGNAFGAVTFIVTRSQRRFDAQDLAMAEELGRRASIAADNSRLYAEAQRTMDELRRASAVKDEFLSLISHELRTPITTIYGNARLLRDKWNRLSEDTREQAARDTAEESERLHRIVENLLLLTQLESGQSPELEPIHLPRLVARWIEAFRRREPSRFVELYVEGHVSPAIGVPTYVELACDNLLGNAHKYSPGDTPITVIVREEDDAAQVLVRDSGPGIDPAEVDQLFSPFYRSRRTGSGAKGIGIGLAVSRRVIEAQGGTIWARALPRAGSEFGFSLMLAQSEHEESPERTSRRKTG